MADIYIDRTSDGTIEVKVCRGASAPKISLFSEVGEARCFANGKLGKRGGIVLDTTDMSPAQLAAHRARQARLADALAQLVG